jgi:5-formyltetrahydrofolate cyclo-ligase
VYAPLGGELDVTPVAATATRDGKAVYYPRVGAAGLEFVRAETGALRPGRFGVLEPTEGVALEPGTEPTLFVVPGVAFDLRGVRLGRGGGHYDRALAAHPAPARLGIAYEFQIVPRLPQAAWDAPMSGVVTDARLIGDCAAVAP